MLITAARVWITAAGMLISHVDMWTMWITPQKEQEKNVHVPKLDLLS